MDFNLRSYFLLLLVFFMPSHGWANPMNNEAESLAREFYSWHLSKEGSFSGLPLKEQKHKISYFFSKELQGLFDAAASMEKQCEQNTPNGDKPFYIEGSIIFSIYEGATEVEVIQPPKADGNIFIFDVRGILIDDRSPKAHKYRISTWVDKVVLEKINLQWVIKDIHFEEGSLTTTLSSYVEQGKKWCTAPTDS